MTTPEIAGVLAQKIQFNTFGGNPVCSAGGLAVLNVLDREKRQQHCAEVGSHMIGRLRELQLKHDSISPNLNSLSLHIMLSVEIRYVERNSSRVTVIGDVRGRGLMVGVELVTDRKQKTPAKAETAVLFESLRGSSKILIVTNSFLIFLITKC